MKNVEKRICRRNRSLGISWAFCLLLLFCLLLSGCQEKGKAEKEKKEEQITVRVKDLTPPTITLTSYEVEVIVNTEGFNPKSYLKEFYDNYDSDIKIKITGKADTNTPGEYFISFSAKDETGNATNRKLKVIVKAKPKKEVNEIPESNKPTNNDVPTKPSLKPAQSTLPPKQFLFANGYTMPTGSNPATTACTSYMSQVSSGGCYPIVSQDGVTYLGMEYLP